MSDNRGGGAFGPWYSALPSSSPSLRAHPTWLPFLLKESTVILSHPTPPALMSSGPGKLAKAAGGGSLQDVRAAMQASSAGHLDGFIK